MKVSSLIPHKTLLTAIRLLTAVSMLTVPAGCVPTFTLNGSAINYDVYKTVHIGEFPIRASLVYPPLQQTFENELLDAVSRQTRLTETSGAADLDLTGEITGYSLTPQAVGENAYATQTRLTITVHVKYTDHKNSANDIDQSFSAYKDFSSDLMLIDVQDELCKQISEELVDLIFNATFGNW